jgi:hypothetical protein
MGNDDAFELTGPSRGDYAPVGEQHIDNGSFWQGKEKK